MKLTVVIVNYNVKYFVEQCLNSLTKALAGIESQIVVVDNHSQDGSGSYLRSRFPGIQLIESNHNLGFSRANNLAIRKTESEYVLLLNPDTFVGEDAISRALSFMAGHPQAGGAGVKMHNADGSVAMESRRGLPTPLTSFLKMCGRTARYYMSYLPWDEPVRIEVISGAFCLLRREALDKVGLLDEDFFMYGEDIDLSYRLLKGGYENWYLPLSIVHYKGESTQKSSFRYVHVFYQAMLIFFRKHYSHMSLCITLPIKLAIYSRAAVALAEMQWYKVRSSLGFTDNRKAEPLYIFVGTPEMLGACREIAGRKGLAAEYIETGNGAASRWTEVQGEVQAAVPAVGSRMTYVVYDTGVFGYQSVISMMSVCPQPHVKLGTYSNQTGIIITPSEIIT
jgi:GT2 family glycosyltransferase